MVSFWIVLWNLFGLVFSIVVGVCCEVCDCCFDVGFVGLRGFEVELLFLEVVGVVLLGLFDDRLVLLFVWVE